MATRLVRAKRRIRDNRIPFALPDRSQLPDRMDAVPAAVSAAYVIDVVGRYQLEARLSRTFDNARPPARTSRVRRGRAA